MYVAGRYHGRCIKEHEQILLTMRGLGTTLRGMLRDDCACSYVTFPSVCKLRSLLLAAVAPASGRGPCSHSSQRCTRDTRIITR